jgi:hypothetical protein
MLLERREGCLAMFEPSNLFDSKKEVAIVVNKVYLKAMLNILFLYIIHTAIRAQTYGFF